MCGKNVRWVAVGSCRVLSSRKQRGIFVAAVTTVSRHLEKARSSVDRPPPSHLSLYPAGTSLPSHGMRMNRFPISFDRSTLTETVRICLELSFIASNCSNFIPYTWHEHGKLTYCLNGSNRGYPDGKSCADRYSGTSSEEDLAWCPFATCADNVEGQVEHREDICGQALRTNLNPLRIPVDTAATLIVPLLRETKLLSYSSTFWRSSFYISI